MCISSDMRFWFRLLDFPNTPFIFVYSIFSLFIYIYFFLLTFFLFLVPLRVLLDWCGSDFCFACAILFTFLQGMLPMS